MTYNGTRRTLETAPTVSLYQLISERGQEEGPCADGRCMRCAVLLGGRVVPSCLVPAYRAADATIEDLDGLAEDPLYLDIARAFEKVGLNRCRETYPAMVMLARQLISEIPLPSDADLRAAGGELVTRCASRDEFERAVRLAARVHSRRRRE